MSGLSAQQAGFDGGDNRGICVTRGKRGNFRKAGLLGWDTRPLCESKPRTQARHLPGGIIKRSQWPRPCPPADFDGGDAPWHLRHAESVGADEELVC